MGNQLADFIRGRKEKWPVPDVDWLVKKDAWVLAVEDLYQHIREMLRDSIASNDVTIKTFPVDVIEDFIEPYRIPVLELKIGNERVEFRPKGITVIGAAGRVDIRGERGTVTLLRDVAGVDGVWSVLVQRVPNVKTLPLDPESLKYALERVMLP